MPARSEAQRRYLNMKFGHNWVKKHGYDNKGKLPKHAKRRDDKQDEGDRLREAFLKRKKKRGHRG